MVPGRPSTQAGMCGKMLAMAEGIHFGAAVRVSDLRPQPATEETQSGLGVQTIEGPMTCEFEHGIEGGTNGSQTLCGVPRDELAILRHIWRPTSRFACPRCQGVALG